MYLYKNIYQTLLYQTLLYQALLYQTLLYRTLLYRECTVVNAAVFPSGGSCSRPNGYLLQYPLCHGWGYSTWRYRQCRNKYTQRFKTGSRYLYWKIITKPYSEPLPIWIFACLIFYNRPIASWEPRQISRTTAVTCLHSLTPTQVAAS